MALDRQSIERRDFPIARRGYDTEAVDAHLTRVADEMAALQGEGGQRSPESVAAVAGAQVASIVEAAEQSAAAIERAAEEDAERVRREAERAASTAREDALERSRAHVHRVAEAAGLISDRIDAMDSELRSLSETLRAGAQRLQADLALLSGNMEELYASTSEAPAEAASEPEPEPEPEAPAPQAEEATEGSTSDPAPEARSVSGDSPVDGPDHGDAASGGGADADGQDVEGARLIALNMALNGTSREETDRYLAENFDLRDRAGLLDEVYASVDG
ncbi:MAG TPA: DivIVA domain-containing protein [Solirubrobacteraceae bacterium]|nr:DivIVA domain-containing protein [Solirubrobacteraceae bacterium]